MHTTYNVDFSFCLDNKHQLNKISCIAATDMRDGFYKLIHLFPRCEEQLNVNQLLKFFANSFVLNVLHILRHVCTLAC
jgi:hypothetical protein